MPSDLPSDIPEDADADAAEPDLYDIAFPVLFDRTTETRRDTRPIIKQVVDHGGVQYRVTLWSSAGILSDGYLHPFLGRREAVVEEALRCLGRAHNAGVSPKRRSLTVRVFASDVKRELQAVGEAFSVDGICEAVRLLQSMPIEIETVSGKGPLTGTRVFPVVGVEKAKGDARLVVQFNDSPDTCRRLGVLPALT